MENTPNTRRGERVLLESEEDRLVCLAAELLEQLSNRDSENRRLRVRVTKSRAQERAARESMQTAQLELEKARIAYQTEQEQVVASIDEMLQQAKEVMGDEFKGKVAELQAKQESLKRGHKKQILDLKQQITDRDATLMKTEANVATLLEETSASAAKEAAEAVTKAAAMDVHRAKSKAHAEKLRADALQTNLADESLSGMARQLNVPGLDQISSLNHLGYPGGSSRGLQTVV